MDKFGFRSVKEGLACLFGNFFPMFILSYLSSTALFIFVHDLNILVFLTFFPRNTVWSVSLCQLNSK